jgi:DNA polymerase III epsilon subunit-like protein
MTDTGEIVLYDTEFTAWEGSQERDWAGPDEFREIIQIGAVRVDPGRDFAEITRFARVVRPWRYPVLSDYVTALTGITNATVASEGVSFADAYRAFEEFTDGRHCYAFGFDYKVLCENCGLNVISAPQTDRFHNLRPFLGRLDTGLPALATGDLPAYLGIDNPGDPHSAIDDAAALAMSLGELRRRGVLGALPGDLGA